MKTILLLPLFFLSCVPGPAKSPATSTAGAVWSTQPVSNTFYYRANAGLDSISVGSIDLLNGGIVEHAAISTSATPSSLAIKPTHDYLYVANAGSANISRFSVDQSTGLLTWISDTSTYAEPKKLIMHPTGKFLFTLHANNSQISTHTVHSVTGALTFAYAQAVGGPGARALTMDPQGRFLIANSNSYIRSYTINQTTGELTYSNNQSPMIYNMLAAHPTEDRIYGVSGMYGDIWGFDLDLSTGALTASSNTTGNSSFPYTAIQFDTTGDYAYLADGYTNTLESYSVATNGYMTFLNAVSLPSGCYASAVKISDDGSYAFVSCSSSTGKTLTFGVNGNGTLSVLNKSSSIQGALISDALLVTF